MKRLSFLAFFSLLGCSGVKPDNLGVNEGKLLACPSSPNCVSSFETDDRHQISPLNGTIAEIKDILLSKERVSIIEEDEHYLYAEFSSKIMGFVDDVEFYYDSAQKICHVRSASRIGRSDLGVNRKRVEGIRSELSSN